MRQRTIRVDGPFSLPLMYGSMRRRPNEVVDLVIGGEYRRLLVHRGRSLLLRAGDLAEDPTALLLTVHDRERAPDEADLDAAETTIRSLFSLDHSPQAFYDHVRDEPVLGPLSTRLWGMRALGSPSIFEMLVIAILGQQISMIAAGAIKARMVQRLSASAMFGQRTYYAFPTAETLAETTHEQLVSLAFSRRKAEHVRDLALQVASGDLDLEALRGRPHLEILERLISLRGIGRWTAEYVLLRGYGYPDALPAGDAGLRRQIMRCYGLPAAPDEEEILRMGVQWMPYRSWATLYLWNADLESGQD